MRRFWPRIWPLIVEVIVGCERDMVLKTRMSGASPMSEPEEINNGMDGKGEMDRLQATSCTAYSAPPVRVCFICLLKQRAQKGGGASIKEENQTMCWTISHNRSRES